MEGWISQNPTDQSGHGQGELISLKNEELKSSLCSLGNERKDMEELKNSLQSPGKSDNQQNWICARVGKTALLSNKTFFQCNKRGIDKFTLFKRAHTHTHKGRKKKIIFEA